MCQKAFIKYFCGNTVQIWKECHLNSNHRRTTACPGYLNSFWDETHYEDGDCGLSSCKKCCPDDKRPSAEQKKQNEINMLRANYKLRRDGYAKSQAEVEERAKEKPERERQARLAAETRDRDPRARREYEDRRYDYTGIESPAMREGLESGL
ncbi:hypothetical protein F4808DRAFT_138305 [Astrocystis sublimbata]|nr:hypothetical protein F4808DRAFT_138305 [Astrocystis sublimbata]